MHSPRGSKVHIIPLAWLWWGLRDRGCDGRNTWRQGHLLIQAAIDREEAGFVAWQQLTFSQTLIQAPRVTLMHWKQGFQWPNHLLLGPNFRKSHHLLTLPLKTTALQEKPDTNYSWPHDLLAGRVTHKTYYFFFFFFGISLAHWSILSTAIWVTLVKYSSGDDWQIKEFHWLPTQMVKLKYLKWYPRCYIVLLPLCLPLLMISLTDHP